MGFWSTLLVALRFKAARLQVVTEPLHNHRVRPDLSARLRFVVDARPVDRFVNDIESASRARLEAR